MEKLDLKFERIVIEDIRGSRRQSTVDAKRALASKILMTCVALCCFSFSAKAKDIDSDWNSPSRDFTFYDSTPANSSQTATSVQSKGMKGKWNLYLKSTYGPLSFGYSLASAGIDQAQDSVPDWGQGMKGYSKRFISGFGKKVVDNSAQFALRNLFHENPRYIASGRSGFLGRMIYAVQQEMISRKDSGGVRIGYTQFIAATTGVVVSRQWQPAAERTAGKYIGAIATSIAWDAALNIVSEFWPRK